jgi:hypothetical protein
VQAEHDADAHHVLAGVALLAKVQFRSSDPQAAEKPAL